ncbi:DNA (cytosine-5-)-methyltransferase [Acholeplasma equirhinis]|uniref:DNA (cytosine-5-)-methyltransferase n=1 Tax=Acholeplasma equirhinis TaxID=555393 RepID=UPI00197AF923|nr:DNA (cytosine-5-)-methyltransferase [Acholeplasma equirhinis]MBN3489924.1 DNA (cytosine-5-)-methyltransferase [Acholeplasma equirhinis]
MNVVELFTGIGSQAKALSRIANRMNIEVNILKTCEWNIHAILAYHFIHNGSSLPTDIQVLDKNQVLEKLNKFPLSADGKIRINPSSLKFYNEDLLKNIYHAIIANNNLVDITETKGHDIPNETHLLTYSFPCQDLSNVGSFHGYKNGIDRDKNTRSGLLWEVERILEEKVLNNQPLPRYLLLENVTALEAKRHEGNFQQWKEKLEKLGYINKVYRLNSEDFTIPQYRKRLIMLSVYVGDDNSLKDAINNYWIQHDLENREYLKTLNLVKQKLDVFLRRDYSNSVYLQEALEAQPNATNSRLKIWELNSKIVNENDEVNNRVQTITTKQDRHPNSGNLYFDPKNGKSKYRFLTPRECFILMGFDEKDYEILLENNFYTRKNSKFFSRDVLYKLAGNSIVVNVLEAVFEQMVEIDKLYLSKSILVYSSIKDEEHKFI